MSKEKAIKLIEDADICVRGYLRNGCRDLLPMALEKLHEAKEELLKPDWISVEDKLPEFNEDVLVCNKSYPSRILITTRCTDVFYDNHNFIIQNMHVTHWHKIEKLEV